MSACPQFTKGEEKANGQWTNTDMSKHRRQKHLKPLSQYARMIGHDSVGSFPDFVKPLNNLKIEIRNSCEKKHKMDDSSLDESVNTPPKKLFRPQTLSPDLGCFVDSPLLRQDPATSNRRQSVGHPVDDFPCSSPSEKVPYVAPVFDLDVDDILCLSPFGNNSNRMSDSEKSCKSQVGTIFAAVPLGKMQRKDGHPVATQEKVQELHLNTRSVEEDRGYFSSYMEDQIRSKELSQTVVQQPPQASSGQLLLACEVEANKHQSESSASGKHSSFLENDLDIILTGSHSSEALEGGEELWNIGLPIFESSMCHNATVNLDGSTSQSKRVSEGGVMDSLHEGGEESTLDTSYETTLPLQVKVKSVVVTIGRHSPSSKPATVPLLRQSAVSTKSSQKEAHISSHRPVSFGKEVDLERDKRMYFQSVTRHMNENPEGNQGVMTELMNLMSHVADRTPGTNHPQWQHPSDLTCRNYQRRFGNLIPSLSLHEWQAKNRNTVKRFAKFRKIFQRSHIY